MRTLHCHLFVLFILSLFSLSTSAQVVVDDQLVSMTIKKNSTHLTVERGKNLDQVIGIDGEYVYLRHHYLPKFATGLASGRHGFAYYQMIEKRRLSDGELIYEARIEQDGVHNRGWDLQSCDLVNGEIFLIYQTYHYKNDSTYLHGIKIDADGNPGAVKRLSSAHTKEYRSGVHQYAWDHTRGVLDVFTKSKGEKKETHLSLRQFNNNLDLIDSKTRTVPADFEDYVVPASKFYNGSFYFIEYFPISDKMASLMLKSWSISNSDQLNIPYRPAAAYYTTWIRFEGDTPFIEGLTPDKKEDYFNGIFRQKVDVKAGKIETVFSETLSTDFVKHLSKFKTRVGKSHARYRLVDEYIMPNGSSILAVSRRFLIHTVGGTIDDYSHFTEDYILFCLDSNGKLSWYRHIPLRLYYEQEDFMDILGHVQGDNLCLFFPNDPNNTKGWRKGKTKAKLQDLESSTLAIVTPNGDITYTDVDQKYNLEELGVLFPGNRNLTCKHPAEADAYLTMIATEDKRLHFGKVKFVSRK